MDKSAKDFIKVLIMLRAGERVETWALMFYSVYRDVRMRMLTLGPFVLIQNFKTT